MAQKMILSSVRSFKRWHRLHNIALRLLTIGPLLVPLQSVLAQGTSLDGTFGQAGKVVTNLSNTSDQAFAVALQSDGKIVAAGISYSEETNHDFAIVRYNIDGSLDGTFGTGGKVITPLSEFDDVAYGVTIQSDGKIVAVGRSQTSVSADTVDFAIVRYNIDGTLDTSFGIGGKVTNDCLGALNEAHAVAIQPDGKIIAAGLVLYTGTSSDFALTRYNPDGTLDTSFGTDGNVITNFSGSLLDAVHCLALQLDGKIVVAGYANAAPVPDGVAADFGVARYHIDGSIDMSFGAGGKVTTNFYDRNNEARGIALQTDGKIVVAGIAWGATRQDFGLVRYTSNGGLDTMFGINGKVTTSFFDHVNRANAVALQSNGRIVVVGSIGNGFAIARYKSNGSLDTSFATGGQVTTAFFNHTAEAYAVAIQPDGKIIAVGSAFNVDTGEDFALARYRRNG